MKITFERFWKDVRRLCNRKRVFCTVRLHRINKVREVREDGIWVIAEGGKKSGDLVKIELFHKTFELIKSRRILKQTRLVKDVRRSAFVFAVCSRLSYFRIHTNPDELELKQGYEFY